MPRRRPDETTIGVTSFKARCLALIDDVAHGKKGRIVLTKRDRPVAMIVPASEELTPLWGAMRGSVRVTAGIDLTKPTGAVWEADS